MDIASSGFSRGRIIVAVAAVAGVALVVTAVAVFQPQKLFIDQEVNEALPGARLGGTTEGKGAAAQEAGQRSNGAKDAHASAGSKSKGEPSIQTLGAGTFTALAHPAHGRAELLELTDGKRFLRFEDFGVENGPDLRVYLAAAPSSADPAAFEESFIDLGALKGNVGDQNYEIPTGTSLEDYRSAVIWCRRFSAGFAVAPLE